MNTRRLSWVVMALALCVVATVSQSLFGSPVPAAESDTPQVTKIEPPHVTRGSQLTVKVSGRSFANGAKVSFSNPGITVLATTFKKASELDVQIQVAADAPAGATSLFVVNPDDNEVEAPFQVTEGTAVVTTSPTAASQGSAGRASTSAPAPASKPAAQPSDKNAAAGSLQFDVLSLADIASVLTSQSKASGTLAYAAGKLTYTEAGNRVFTVKPGEVKEIAPNTILGMNTGSFHIILNSGKVYNFIAASLKPADSLSIIDALRRAIR